MKGQHTAALAVLLIAMTQPLLSQDKLPPLIDREIFFGDPEYAGAQLSPDGKYVTFLRTNAGQINIWVKRRAEPFTAAVPLTADSTRPVTGYFWSHDSKTVLYVQDKAGDENYHLYAIDPTQAAPGRIPVARDLTPFPKVRVMFIDVPRRKPDRLLVMINDRDPALHDAYSIDIASGKRTLLFKNEQGFVGFSSDLDGNLRLGTKVSADGLGSDVYAISGDRTDLLFTLTCDLFQGCYPLRFHKDGRRLYVINAKADDNLTHLDLFDLQTKTWQKVEDDPEKQVDFGGAAFSDVTNDLIATYYQGDRQRIYPKNAQVEKDLKQVRSAAGDGEIYFGSTTADERMFIVSVSSDVDPGRTYIYDRNTGKVELLYRPRPKLPLQHLAPMKPVRYTARDGLDIPAYLTLPKGVEPRNLPTIILPHGGPWYRDSWGYDAFAQFLANRGYAVLQPNFRGSTGYGRRFLDAGNKGWGTGGMQNDITDGAKWIVQQGVADPKRVAIVGGSYGGYATLAGVAFTPDLYAAGVSIVGPSNLHTFLASIPPYWAPLKKAFDIRLGDPANAQDSERLKEQSPLWAANNIKATLLVIQGANDPRVNKAESDQIVIALRDLGRKPRYLVAADEGHGFARRENRLAMFAEIEKFLAGNIGGRYQPEMPADIQQRLALLSVNVDTLKLPALAKAAVSPAKFNAALMRPGTFKYKTSAELQGQMMQMTSAVNVTQQTVGGVQRWVIAEDQQSPMGAAVDSVELDPTTLAPVHFAAHQGSATVQVALRSDSIVGKIRMGAQDIPINIAVSTGPVFIEGPALNAALGTMDLTPGAAAGIQTLELREGRVKDWRIEVAAVEKVTVPAGSFDAYRLTIKAADGSGTPMTYWIENAPARRMLKMEGFLPAQMGSGKIVSELQ